MSIEIHHAENAAINMLWMAWGSSTDTELEANFKALDYTSFLNIIKYLRSMGLTEEPQETKLHILTPGGLRFTLIGEGVIRAFCRDNTLKGKPFHVILKERKYANRDGLSQVDLNEYGVRIKIRRETILDPMHHRVVEAISKWNSLPKSFRYMKRYQFKSTTHSHIVFDASLVRESKTDARGKHISVLNFKEANIMKQPLRYEMEVEAQYGATVKSLLVGVLTVLRGLQRSYAITRASVKSDIIAFIAAQTGLKAGMFPGAQPVTLHKDNMDPSIDDPEIPNICNDDYNVTDKADGLRCLLVAAKDGKLYMVDRNLNVYGTGRRLSDSDTKEWAGAILDGEWITQNAESKPISRYYAFDVFNGRGGSDVTDLPFISRDGGDSRLAAMTETVAIFDTAGNILPNVPEQHKFSVHMKTFRTPDSPSDQKGIFKECAAIMERLKSDKPYHTDGLIFTPNAASLPKSGTWKQQFKWKPASMNSVDFLVVTEKERNDEDQPTNVERITSQYREDTKQMVRCKTLRLFCGASTHPIFDNPRESVLYEKPIPRKQDAENANYRPIEFSPDLPDPMASVCYVAINAGATDAAGAAPEAQIRESLDDTIYCEESKDPIQDRTIVEMVYDPKKPKGWRWIPMRVRWDKTEQFAQKRLRGTMNSAMVANDVWMSIHNPVTEYMITTGELVDKEVEDYGDDVGTDAYYQKKAPQRDQFIIRELTDFHNKHIKQMLLKAALSGGKHQALIDYSVGQAGDLHKWIYNRAGFVLGCDIAETGINSPAAGAYRRYLNQLISSKSTVPPMLFVQADSSQRIVDGSAGITSEDKIILRTLWGEKIDDAPPAAIKLLGKATYGFDAGALMFSIHYFFKNREMLDGLMRNIAETVKVGGLLVGCCFDGDAVATLLKDEPFGGTKRGTENNTDIWTITKKYDDDGEGIVPASDSGLGMAIDVNFISIGETYTEYLVSFAYLVERMKSIGFEPLNADELSALGLSHSSEMFADTHKSLKMYLMPPKVQMFSFLNRWFIFKRRSMAGMNSLSIPAATVAALTATESPDSPESDSPIELILEEEDENIEKEELRTPEQEQEQETETEIEIETPQVGGSIADGPIYVFNNRSAASKASEMKILKSYGINNKHWRRYLSTYTPFIFHDLYEPSIKYPSLEAALSAAKYQIATNKPELGAQLFSTFGNIHQQLLAQLRKLGDDVTSEDIADLYDIEGNMMRDSGKSAAIKKTGAKFDKFAWDAVKERILIDYVRQRFENDTNFRNILIGMQEQRALLVYTAAANELSGSVNIDGHINGENLYGRSLMRMIGLMY